MSSLTLPKNVTLELKLPEMPYYDQLPDEVKVDPVCNLEYRKEVNRLAVADSRWRNRIWSMVRADILYFVTVFGFVFEPRNELTLPFMPYPFQNEAMRRIKGCLGRRDVVIEKSRDMGATWMVLYEFFHGMLTGTNSHFGIVSRNADVVDCSGGDPSTLFWKLDFIHENLPPWLRPKIRRVRMAIENEEFGYSSGIYGASATQDIWRGGRLAAIMMDELAAFRGPDGYDAWASTQHVTNCRIGLSTPLGAHGIFYDLNKTDTLDMERLWLHWQVHPLKRPGLYRAKGDHVEKLDRTYLYQDDFVFVSDGKLRSPYYDRECARHPSKAKVAQELDIDYTESGYPFFDAQTLDEHKQRHARPPLTRWALDADEAGRPIISKHERGALLVWCPLNALTQPPRDRDYTIGVDVAVGNGGTGTNSVASVKDNLTKEKVAEFAVNHLDPHHFARVVAGLRALFSGPSGIAYLVFEANGPGQSFGKSVYAYQQERIFYRGGTDNTTGRKTRKLGWWSDSKSKLQLLSEYSKHLYEETYINRHAVAIDECRDYVYAQGGNMADTKVEHTRASQAEDPTMAGANHGDRVIADALAAFGGLTRTALLPHKAKVEAPPPVIPYGCYAWRKAEREKYESYEESWS